MAANGFTPTLTNGDVLLPTTPVIYAERVNEEIMALWAALGAGSYQEVTGSQADISDDAALVIINRDAPSATSLNLPSIGLRPANLPLLIFDLSRNVSSHTITVNPDGTGETIMRQDQWQLVSNAASLASGQFIPLPDFNTWLTR